MNAIEPVDTTKDFRPEDASEVDPSMFGDFGIEIRVDTAAYAAAANSPFDEGLSLPISVSQLPAPYMCVV